MAHLSARLAALAAHPAGTVAEQARTARLPAQGAGSLLRQQGSDRLLVDVRLARFDSAAIARLRAAGALIVHEAAYVRTATVAVEPSELLAVARVSGVQYVSEILRPMVSSVCDSTISEGDSILKADLERSGHSVDGTGVTVGVLSDSFDNAVSPDTDAAADVTSDNLPGSTNTCNHLAPVNVLADFTDAQNPPEDEGRAMAQIVHDLAPGAKIMFATAFNGETSFADNIRALANAGADIIVDDVSYFDEPTYQDGVVADAVNDVRAMGVDYFSSAANNNITISNHDVASYEAVDGYRSTTCPVAVTNANAQYGDCHNFNAAGTDATYGITIAAHSTVTFALDWAEPESGVQTDYALCFTTVGGTLIGSCGDDRNPGATGSQQPFEFGQLTNNGSSAAGANVVVARFGGNNPNTNGTPRFKLSFLTNGSGALAGTEYNTPTGTDVLGPVIFGHNGAANAMSVAASDVRAPSVVDDYSSHCPVTLLFGPVNGTTPAAALGSPQVLAKPDFTASDCGRNTFFGFNDGTDWRFCGTSAAAPHAAAAAALLLQQNPDLTPDQINAALTSAAVSFGAGVPAGTQGTGLIDAQASGAAIPAHQTITFAQPANGAVGGTRTLTGTASSGLAVTFTVDAATSPAGACSVSGTNGTSLHYAKAGSCVVDADQAGSAGFTPAKRVKRTIVVKAAPVVTTASLPKGVVGKKYAATLHSSGGNAPVTWSRRSGSLPAGLKLSSSGAISGTPTKAGSFTFTVAVTDSSVPRVSGTRKFTITIAPIAVRTTTLPKGTVGRKYAATLLAYGGKAPLVWKVKSGALPRGLSLARSGAISGKPTKAGTFRFTVQVTDAAGHRAAATLTIVVRKA